MEKTFFSRDRQREFGMVMDIPKNKKGNTHKKIKSLYHMPYGIVKASEDMSVKKPKFKERAKIF